MRAVAALLAGCCVLSGCLSAEQRAANQALREQQSAQDREYRQRAYQQSLVNQCYAIGYRPETDGMRNCVLQLHQAAQAEEAQKKAMILQYMLNQQPQPRPNIPLCSTLPAGMAGYMRNSGQCI